MPVDFVSPVNLVSPADSAPPVDKNSPAVKHNKVLSELKFAKLELPETYRRRVKHLVSDFLDAFAGSQFDVGRTHLIRHRIDT